MWNIGSPYAAGSDKRDPHRTHYLRYSSFIRQKLSQFGTVRLVKPKEGGGTVGVPIQKPSEKVPTGMILLKHP